MAAGGRARRFTFIGLSVALGSILPGLGILFVLSPGRPGPLRDAGGRVQSGSISDKIHVEINGVRQGMFIKSRDPSNPVLLFLHGGTGMPEYFLSRQYPTGFEDCMTVVWWDRPGAGLSYDASAARAVLVSGRGRPRGAVWIDRDRDVRRPPATPDVPSRHDGEVFAPFERPGALSTWEGAALDDIVIRHAHYHANTRISIFDVCKSVDWCTQSMP